MRTCDVSCVVCVWKVCCVTLSSAGASTGVNGQTKKMPSRPSAVLAVALPTAGDEAGGQVAGCWRRGCRRRGCQQVVLDTTIPAPVTDDASAVAANGWLFPHRASVPCRSLAPSGCTLSVRMWIKHACAANEHGEKAQVFACGHVSKCLRACNGYGKSDLANDTLFNK